MGTDSRADTPYEQVWSDTLPLFQAADGRICNLECVLTSRSEAWGSRSGQTWKMFHFRGDTVHVACLNSTGIQAVSLANNHVLDFQLDGLLEMFTLLDVNHIAHAGAGLALDDARHPALWNSRGLTIGMLAITDNKADWAATPDRGGIWYAPLEQASAEEFDALLCNGSARQLGCASWRHTGKAMPATGHLMSTAVWHGNGSMPEPT